ncbi:MAG: hypothetical protein ABI595_05200 [Actinomycetota bacterium]
MAETKAKAKAKATRPNLEDEPSSGASAGPAATAETGHVCSVAFCPIGLALTAVQPLKPDVVEHLLVAGREFFLAAKALLEVRADDLAKDGGSSTFEKIDIG